jgi:hypothetical protein
MLDSALEPSRSAPRGRTHEMARELAMGEGGASGCGCPVQKGMDHHNPD